jgi:hypothetical protein
MSEDTEKLYDVLKDFAEFGLRADTNPTMTIDTTDAHAVHNFFVDYLKRLNQQTMIRAKSALIPVKEMHVGVRQEVQEFAMMMESVLRKHDEAKGHWGDAKTVDLVNKFQEEVREVCEEFFSTDKMYHVRMANETVDVANMCMMMWNNLKNEVTNTAALREHYAEHPDN